MGLVDRVAARAARTIERADPLSLQDFGALLGQGSGLSGKTRAGVTVGAQRSLGISAWWRGVRYLSETQASLPIHSFRDSVAGRSRRSDPPWARKPDVEMTWFGLVEHWMMALLHRGNAFAFKLRSPMGQVVGLRALHPDRVKVGQASDGTKVFQIDNRTDVGFTRREVLHIPGLSYDGVVGLDPIRVHAESLGLIAAADEFAGRHFGQGSHVQAYLSVPQTLTQDQADKLKVQWERVHKGITSAHEFGVLGNGAEYRTVSLDPEQAQLLQTRRFGVAEIARILGVVPHKLYDLERATFSNIEHQAIEAVMDGVRPWSVRLEAWINADLDLMPARNFVEFQLEGLLRGDTKSRYESYQMAILAGWMQPAHAARLENTPSGPELEYYLRPLNHAVIRDGVEEVPERRVNPDRRVEQIPE